MLTKQIKWEDEIQPWHEYFLRLLCDIHISNIEFSSMLR